MGHHVNTACHVGQCEVTPCSWPEINSLSVQPAQKNSLPNNSLANAATSRAICTLFHCSAYVLWSFTRLSVNIYHLDCVLMGPWAISLRPFVPKRAPLHILHRHSLTHSALICGFLLAGAPIPLPCSLLRRTPSHPRRSPTSHCWRKPSFPRPGSGAAASAPVPLVSA